MNATAPIRLLIADDHTILREGLVALLARETDLQVVAEAANGYEALECYRSLRPDIVLTDLRMPGLDGAGLIEAMRAEEPQARAMVLTAFGGDEDIYRCLRAGAQAYLLKNISANELVRTIRLVHAGQKHIPSEVSAKLMERLGRTPLSGREQQVLHLLAQGMNNQAIAAALNIAEGTVKFHINNIVGKLQATDRTHAVLIALRRGIISDLSLG